MSKKLEAKKKVAKALKSQMKGSMMEGAEEMLGKLKPKMMVKIAADSPEGIKEGAEKVEELMEGKGGIGELLKEAFEKRSKKVKKDEYAEGGVKDEEKYLSTKSLREKYPEETKGMSDEDLKDISPKYRGDKKKLKKFLDKK